MSAIRSFLFNTMFFAGGLVLALVLLPCMVLPRRVSQWGLKMWGAVMMWFLKVIAGLSWEVKGLENLPDEPCIFACKHQSAWETGIFHQLVPDPAYILKKELLSIPFFGWYLGRGGAVAIDRKAGASALKLMIKGTQDRLARGQHVVIFPEGTRAAPGKAGTYHPGVAALYKGVDAPVVPVALNSGLFWQRRSFLKRPGKITMEILPAIAPGQDRKAFMAELKSTIEDASNRLADEARARYPQALPAPSSSPSPAPSSAPSNDSDTAVS